MVLFGLDSSIFAPEFGDSASFGSASANSAVCFLITFSAVSQIVCHDLHLENPSRFSQTVFLWCMDHGPFCNFCICQHI